MKEPMTETSPFLTKDVYLASYLCFKGMTLVGAATYDGTTEKKFAFIDAPGREAYIEEWVTGSEEAFICKTYASKMRTVKKVLYGPKV